MNNVDLNERKVSDAINRFETDNGIPPYSSVEVFPYVDDWNHDAYTLQLIFGDIIE